MRAHFYTHQIKTRLGIVRAKAIDARAQRWILGNIMYPLAEYNFSIDMTRQLSRRRCIDKAS